jgi:hypothetical protein
MAQSINPADEAVLEEFMPKTAKKRLTLADAIMGRIKEKETEIASQMSGVLLCCRLMVPQRVFSFLA